MVIMVPYSYMGNLGVVRLIPCWVLIQSLNQSVMVLNLLSVLRKIFRGSMELFLDQQLICFKSSMRLYHKLKEPSLSSKSNILKFTTSIFMICSHQRKKKSIWKKLKLEWKSLVKPTLWVQLLKFSSCFQSDRRIERLIQMMWMNVHHDHIQFLHLTSLKSYLIRVYYEVD